MSTSVLLVELDTLLDTRLACLYTHFGQEAVQRALTQGYFTRSVDKFPGIEYEAFQTAYRARNREVLRHALRTPITRICSEFVLGTYANLLNTPFHEEPQVWVNCAPYALTQDEKTLIERSVSALIGHRALVRAIEVTYEEMTPEWVREGISLMLLYDYQDWLEAQSVNGAFRKKAVPDVTLMAPAIFKKYPLTPKDQQILARLDTPIFEYLKKAIAPFVNVLYLPIEHFSVDRRYAQAELKRQSGEDGDSSV